MMHFTIRIGSPVVLIIEVMARTVAFKTGNIPDRGIQPDIKILPGLAGNLKPKIRRISGNVPVLQSSIEPFRQFVGDSRM
jgi:3-hydroxymyristoyl/3-hydroxydecanoyl-(acyl carrier protein) dehydratase